MDLRVGVTMPINANLEVGATSDTVEVTASTPLLETETSSHRQMVEGEFFYRMPLFQRSPKAIMYITPGITVRASAGRRYGRLPVNGESSGRIGYFEDGMYGVSPNGTVRPPTPSKTPSMKLRS